jgi:hypothetical protein
MSASIPVEVQDITSSWLQDVMRRHAPGAVPRAIDVIEAHSGTTGRARVVPTHDDPCLPGSVFVKLAQFEVALPSANTRTQLPWPLPHAIVCQPGCTASGGTHAGSGINRKLDSAWT